MKLFVLASILAVLATSVAYSVPQTPAVELEKLSTTSSTERYTTRRFTYSVDCPFFTTASDVSRLASDTVKAYVAKEKHEFIGKAEAEWQKAKSGDDPGIYRLQLKATIALATPDLVSVRFERITSIGDAPAHTEYPTMTFGQVGSTAKRLELGDLFRDGFTLPGGLDAAILPTLRTNTASFVTNGTLKTLGPAQLTSWYLSPTGITFAFAPSVVGAASEGSFSATASYNRLRSLIDSKGPLQSLL